MNVRILFVKYLCVWLTQMLWWMSIFAWNEGQEYKNPYLRLDAIMLVDARN